jgi:hypothetical protein
LLKEKRTLLAVQLIQTGLEACQKYSAHFEDVRVYTEQLTSLRRIADIPWAAIDWDDVDRRVRAVRTRLVISLGQALPALAALPHAEQWPDYFGLAYSVLSQEAYIFMATGNEALFQKIIPSVFVASLSAPSRVADQLQDIDATMRFIYSTEPVEDILELSGYALIFSELDGKGFWNTMKGLWNKYFAQQPAPQDEADRIMNIIKARQAWLTIFPRAFVRGAPASTQPILRTYAPCTAEYAGRPSKLYRFSNLMKSKPASSICRSSAMTCKWLMTSPA